MVSTFTEPFHTGEFLVSEANGSRSREVITLLSGSTLDAGAVLGQALIDVTSVTGVADAGNASGTGAVGTVSAGTGAQVGAYRIVCLEPASGGGTFAVFDPYGVEIGKAAVGSAFTGQIVFTIADGTPDFVAGEAFTVTVAAGSGKYKEYNPANADGSNVPKAILFADADASTGDLTCVAIVRDAEVNAELLAWFTGATNNQKTAAIALLKNVGIIARSE